MSRAVKQPAPGGDGGGGGGGGCKCLCDRIRVWVRGAKGRGVEQGTRRKAASMGHDRGRAGVGVRLSRMSA